MHCLFYSLFRLAIGFACIIHWKGRQFSFRLWNDRRGGRHCRCQYVCGNQYELVSSRFLYIFLAIESDSTKFDAYSWTVMTWVVVVGSTLVMMLWIVIYSFFPSSDFVDEVVILFGTIYFWASVLLAATICLGAFVNSFERIFNLILFGF